MNIYLIDGTYELFRYFFAVPPSADGSGQEIGATRGVLNSLLSMIEGGATRLGVATDHVVESFRNDLYPGYKTSEGVPPELLSQFPILESALEAMGVKVWAMTEFEADDALASAAALAERDDRVAQVLICTPDKDLSQCVVGTRVVQLDRRRNIVRDHAGVEAKFGVGPQSIPDYLALVGDSADGYPGIAGWGAKTAALALARYPHLEAIPRDWRQWHASIRRARPLSESLFNSWDDALLFRRLATLRLDVPVFDSIDDLQWKGPRPEFDEYCRRLKSPALLARALAAASGKFTTVTANLLRYCRLRYGKCHENTPETELATATISLQRVARHNPLAAIGVALVILFVVLALFAPWIAPQDPAYINLANRLAPPSSAHWCGTDELGRDILSRLIYGSRISMLVGSCVVAGSLGLGLIIGSIAGYYGGGVDRFVNVVVMNAFLSFPGILIAIAFVAFRGPGIFNLIFALSLGGWVGYARLVRAQVLAAREREFVEAARALGAGRFAHHRAPHPAQHYSAHHRAGCHRHGRRDTRRSDHEFSRTRRPSSHRQLGSDAERRPLSSFRRSPSGDFSRRSR